MATQPHRAKLFLEQKLRETIAECGVPALAAVLVREAGATAVSAQQGVRKAGAAGAQNNVRPHDRFNLGSISKVFTGNLIGKLVQDGVLDWETRIADVYASIWDNPAARDGYKRVTVEQLLAHTSGMPYSPAQDDAGDWKTYTAEDMTMPRLRQRRRNYIKAAVLDPPKFWPPDTGVEYGGGGIIAASMAEHKTGRIYEDLMRIHIYGPLGMNDSGFGELSPGALDGPWQHRWDEATRTLQPDSDTKRDGFNWNPRSPVGGACCSAADLGKFIREQLRSDPQVFSVSARKVMQTRQVAAASSFVRGAWASSAPGSDQADISHNGDNGVSYANMVVSLSKKAGFGAMSNANSRFGAPAVEKMIEVLRMLNAHWNQIAAEAGGELVECAHPMPAVAVAGQKMLVFARRHDGKVFRYRSTDSGASWQAAGDFGGAVFTSGLAADADGRRVHLCGRGKDNQIWFTSSADGGAGWADWKPVAGGAFMTGPAVTAGGGRVNAFAVGMDGKIYSARSVNGGQSWGDWKPVGEGKFTSAPAAAASTNGSVIHVFGRGEDRRIWRNVSFNGGASWEAHWEAIGEGVFTSGPAAAASGGGAGVHVVARGTDRQLWRNTSSNSGAGWLEHWQVIPPVGTFTSAPALAATDGGSTLNVFAFGGDFGIYKNRSADGGQGWANWQRVGAEWFL